MRFNHFYEGQFDNVDMGSSSMMVKIAQFRRNLAQNLEEMIADKELNPAMTLAQVIAVLKQ